MSHQVIQRHNEASAREGEVLIFNTYENQTQSTSFRTDVNDLLTLLVKSVAPGRTILSRMSVSLGGEQEGRVSVNR
jgi:hypothetical protein